MLHACSPHLIAPRPQAPRLRELRCNAFLDLWSGPWDGLARLASLRTLVLTHGCYSDHAGSSGQRHEDADGAYARDLHERGRLGWLLGQAQEGVAQEGRLQQDRPQKATQRRSSRVAAHLPAAGGAGSSSSGGGQGLVGAPNAPRFELAWLPRGLERCSIALPAGTRVVPQPEADQPQPLAFKVDGSTVELG